MLVSLALGVLALVCVALVVFPASAFARSYVDALAPGVRVRGPGLLDPLSQGLLALGLGLATAWWGWRSGAAGETVTALPAVAVLGVAASTDAVCHRLPNRLLAAAGAWVAASLVVRSVVEVATGTSLPQALWPAGRGVLCALAAFLVLFVMALIPSGMGVGDAKLVAVLGLWLGSVSAKAVAAALVTGFMLGGLVALALLALRRVGRKDFLAFGPYLAAGGWLAWLAWLA